jgi:hypothetical protein
VFVKIEQQNKIMICSRLLFHAWRILPGLIGVKAGNSSEECKANLRPSSLGGQSFLGRVGTS